MVGTANSTLALVPAAACTRSAAENLDLMCTVLPANSTIGYDDFNYLIVKKVNGKEVKSLGDLAEAVKHPINGFHVIETQDDPKQLELNAAEVAADADALQKNYGLPALQRLP